MLAKTKYENGCKIFETILVLQVIALMIGLIFEIGIFILIGGVGGIFVLILYWGFIGIMIDEVREEHVEEEIKIMKSRGY